MGLRRERRPSLVITFPTTAAAMACEETCQRQGLPGRMIPVPGEISAGCGLAWKAEPDARGRIEAALAEEGVAAERYSVVELLEFVREGAEAGRGEASGPHVGGRSAAGAAEVRGRVPGERP